MNKKKKIIIPENYLDRIPLISEEISFSEDEKGIVTLKIENRGWANRIAQKLFFRPKFSFIHLDAFGSFVWNNINGESDITEIGKAVEEKFGEEAHPLYERLARYFQILESYRFIKWASDTSK